MIFRLRRHVLRIQPLMWLAVAGLTAYLLLLTPGLAHATVRPPKLALIKDNDLAAIGTRYGHDFWYIACGIGTGGPYASKWAPCKPGQVRTYGSEAAFAADVASRVVIPGQTVLLDVEAWKWTPPAEQANPARFLRLAGQLARAHHIGIIETVNFGSLTEDVALSAVAARYASVVAAQTQGAEASPASFLSVSRRYLAAIRAVSRVPLWLGLATDPGGKPVRPRWLIADYAETYGLVQGFWLNANQWNRGPVNGCERTGCGAIGRAFLAGIGVPT